MTSDTCCFSTVVYGWYQDFIPIHIYSTLKAYPQHFVKIFLLDKLQDRNREALDAIRTVSNRFEVVENFTDLDWCKIPHGAALRFLLTREYFEGFKYAYFGDVDMLLYNFFRDNFTDYYLWRCRETELPFSNSFNYDKGRYRLTGLHFIIKDPYFDAMDKVIEEMKIPRRADYWGKGFRSQCKHNEKDPSYDEEMLFNMVSSVFDMRKLQGYERPYHGWHLGDYRTHYLKRTSAKERSMFLHKMCYQRPSERWQYDEVTSLINDELFLKLREMMQGESRFVVDAAIRVFTRKCFL